MAHHVLATCLMHVSHAEHLVAAVVPVGTVGLLLVDTRVSWHHALPAGHHVHVLLLAHESSLTRTVGTHLRLVCKLLLIRGHVG